MKNARLGVFLAVRDVFDNKGSLVFISAALGFLFANVLFSRFMMYGFETSIGQLIRKVSGHVYIAPPRGQPYIQDIQEVVSEIKSKNSVTGINPVLEMPCVLEYEGSRIVTMVWGVVFNEQIMQLKNHIVEGRYFSGPYAKEVILGRILKKRFELKIPKGMNVGLWDTIKAMFIKEHNLDKFNREVYHDRLCDVVGVADFRDYVANNSIFMPIDALRRIVILGDRASAIFIRLSDNGELSASDVQKFNPADERGEAKHWRDRDDYGTDDLVYGFNLISTIIFVVSIICAAILVAFIIYYNTQKKRRTTGILRAVGIRDNVFLIFYILEGTFFSLIGVVAGTVIYSAMELYLRNNPIAMSFGDLYPMFEAKSYFLATTLFIAVSFIASVYYAAKSSRENIIKIIRGD